jgi:hypothetical protein
MGFSRVIFCFSAESTTLALRNGDVDITSFRGPSKFLLS